MLRSIPRHVLLLLAVATVAGCDSNTDVVYPRAPGGETPVAGAIEWRTPNNAQLGVIGTGSIGGSIQLGTPALDDDRDCGEVECAVAPERLSMGSVYPNPTPGRATVQFDLPGATEVIVFVVAALPPGNAPSAQFGTELSARIYRPGGYPVATPVIDQFSAGSQAVALDFTEMAGGTLPQGYYRVYVQTPYRVAWRDVLFDPSYQF